MSDLYQTISQPSEGEFRDRGSKFIAYAYPVYSLEACQERQEAVRKLHPKARHHCYAYRLQPDGQLFRANDDGEPSGTAGRPILGQIDSFGLTNVIVIVIRYFGGTKLGTSGLINAYKTSAMEAFKAAKIIEKTVENLYQLHFDYALMSNVMNAVKKLQMNILAQDFTDSGRLEVAIRQSEVDDQLLRLKALVAKVRIEEAAALKGIPGLKVSYLRTR
ncbi:MAG: YigZ family protein [Bacteroidota bacterium]